MPKNRKKRRGGKGRKGKKGKKGRGGFRLPGLRGEEFFGDRSFNLDTKEGAIGAQLAQQERQADLLDEFNRLNQEGPTGSRTFTTDAEGNRVVTDEMSPELRQLFDSITAQANASAQQFGAIQDPLSFDQFGALPQSQDFDAARSRIEGELFNRFEAQNAPLFNQERQQLETTLTQRGVPIGSELYNKQLAQLDQRQNDIREGYRDQAFQQAGDEANNQFQNALQSRGVGTAEALTLRDRPLQELGSLLGLQQGVIQPNFGGINPVQLPGVDVAGTGLAFDQLAAQLRGQDLSAASAGASRPQFRDYLGEIQARGAQDRANVAFASQYQQQPQQVQQASPGVQIGASFLGGLGTGLGSYFK
jgi:hypothetical protein